MNDTLEIRRYCLRLLVESGKSYSAAEKILDEVAYNLQKTAVRFNVVKE